MTWALHAGQRASPVPTNRQQMPATKKRPPPQVAIRLTGSRRAWLQGLDIRSRLFPLDIIRPYDDGPPLPTALDSRGIGRLLCRALICYNLLGWGTHRYMGGLHHVAREAGFEAKEWGESRNGIGSRWGVVAGGRRVRSGRWSAARYSDGEHGSYSQ